MSPRIITRLIPHLLLWKHATRNLLTRGTLKSSGTGVIECEIRLPCSHRVGSACIATWLRTNNTCPVCRRVLFPAVAGQPLERDDELEEEDLIHDNIALDDPATEHVNRIHSEILDSYYYLFEELDLSLDTFELACKMAAHLCGFQDPGDPSPRETLVDTTIYIVTHIKNEHKSLEEIASASCTQVERIRRMYRKLWPIRDRIAEQHWDELEGPSGSRVYNLLDLLPFPNTVDDSTDYEADGSDPEDHAIHAQLSGVRELFNQYSDALGLSGDIRNICIRLADRIMLFRFSLPVAAVSLFMLSHIMELDITIRQISEVAGISEGSIRRAYRTLYPLRGDFFLDSLLHDIRRYRVVQYIAWPAI